MDFGCHNKKSVNKYKITTYWQNRFVQSMSKPTNALKAQRKMNTQCTTHKDNCAMLQNSKKVSHLYRTNRRSRWGKALPFTLDTKNNVQYCYILVQTNMFGNYISSSNLYSSKSFHIYGLTGVPLGPVLSSILDLFMSYLNT